MNNPSYSTNDPKGWMGDPKRGAAMGRSTIVGKYDGSKLTLRKVPIDSGGYDPNGTYFGLGGRMYWCASGDGEIDFMLRATSREDAKSTVRKYYPKAEFLR